VFRPHDRCENYLLVTEGKVKVSLLTPSGHELLLYRVEPGESCVLTTTCLMAAKPYPAEGVTETEVTALMIPKTAFDQTLAESESFRQIVFDHLSHRFADIIGRIETVKFSDLDTRLANELLRQMDSEQTVFATHQALATEIGTSREVVSRHLKELEHRGLIQLGRGQIKVTDTEALRNIGV
jgi:CRP/FNR family transcriptional regulator